MTCELRAIDAASPTDTKLVDASIDAPMLQPDAATIPMLIQQATNYGELVETLSVTLPTAPAANRVLVMIGANVSGSLTTVSGGGATWTRAAQSLINSNVEIWFGVTNGTSSTVTIAKPGSAAPTWMHVAEWSGLATTNSIDTARADDGAGATITAGSITTTTTRDLLLFAATASSPTTFGTPTPGTWVTLQGITSTTFSQGEWYRIVTANDTFAPSVTQTGSGNWEAAVAAFRIAP